MSRPQEEMQQTLEDAMREAGVLEQEPTLEGAMRESGVDFDTSPLPFAGDRTVQLVRSVASRCRRIP